MRFVLAALLAVFLASGAAADAEEPAWLWITSPVTNEDLSGRKQVPITWESNLGDAVSYSVVYSGDERKFDAVIAAGLTATQCVWSPGSSAGLLGWIKVKAFSSSGDLLAEDVVPVTFIPPKSVVVSKADQKVFYFSAGRLKHVFRCSTALPKYDLAAGRYKVYLRQRNHRSREYDVDMPYSMFFHRGYALHATRVIRRLGRPASHGCIRLHPRDAKTLYGEVEVGTPVIVLPHSQSCSKLVGLLDQHAVRAAETAVSARR